MVTKGDLVFLLDVDTTQYEKGFERARDRIPSFEREMKRSLQRLPDLDRGLNSSGNNAGKAAGGYGKANRALLELSRGVEDAASVYGTMGLSGALRASANNISQFASIIHPAAGAIAGFGVAIGSILIPKLFETDDAADKAKSSMDALTDSISKARAEAQRKFELEDIIEGGSTSIDRETKRLRRSEAEIEAAIAAVDRERKKLLEKEGVQSFHPATGFGPLELARPGQRDFSSGKDVDMIPGQLGDTGIGQELNRFGRDLNRDLFPILDQMDLIARDVGSTLSFGMIDDAETALKRMDDLTDRQKAAYERDRQLQQQIVELDRERLELVKERTGLEDKSTSARLREENQRHSDMRARDIEQAREEERELKKEAEQLAQRQEQFRQSLTDDLDPVKGRESTILKEFRGRRREIDELFGGDPELQAQAEEAARQKLLGLDKSQGELKLPSGSPAAFAAGSSAAIGLINRSANEAVPIARQQLDEQRKLTHKIDRLIAATKNGSSNSLPPADISGP